MLAWLKAPGGWVGSITESGALGSSLWRVRTTDERATGYRLFPFCRSRWHGTFAFFGATGVVDQVDTAGCGGSVCGSVVDPGAVDGSCSGRYRSVFLASHAGRATWTLFSHSFPFFLFCISEESVLAVSEKLAILVR